MHLRNYSLLIASLLASSVALGDDITVSAFTPNTTISSSAMNTNFATIVAESNENDGRIAANASEINTITTRLDGTTYSWLGWTTNLFTRTSASKAIGPNLSLFCKTEFNDSKASVADLDFFENVIRSGSFLPPSTPALALYSHGFYVNSSYPFHPFWGDTYLQGTNGLCQINSTDDGYFNIDCGVAVGSGNEISVACVTQN